MRDLRSKIIRLAHQQPDLRPHLLPLLKSAALPNGTVQTFLMVLRSKITQYDKRVSAIEAKKGRVNIYRLSLLLRAAEQVEADMKRLLNKDDPESLEKMKASLEDHFVPNFPPVKATINQIDGFLQSGKKPTLV